MARKQPKDEATGEFQSHEGRGDTEGHEGKLQNASEVGTAAEASPAAPVSKTVYTEVPMDDGRVVKFPGKRRLQKSAEVDDATNEISVRFDFVHGESRIFKLSPSHVLFLQFAAHGIEQKIGDEVAGMQDPEDMVIAVDSVMERLQAGDWTARREENPMAGASVLVKALVQMTGKDVAFVKAFLEGKSNAEKLALRNSPKVAPIIAELEKNKKPKEKPVVDTDALLGALEG